jgi:Nucleotidyl transferase AbiEii toxin, Type IV TA system
MDEFADRSPSERAEVFEETAVQKGIGRAAIVEKDFWVCWTLAALFGPGGPADVTLADVPALLFKGGTSLSKVYGLIDRFSEDVDLTVDRRLLITDEERPEAAGVSTRERKRRIDTVEQRCIAYVHDTLLPFLRSRRISGHQLDVRIDATDAQTIWLAFPQALSAAAGSSAFGGALRLA